MDTFQVGVVAMLSCVLSILLVEYTRNPCCSFKRCQCIPEFRIELAEERYDMKKLGLIAKALYEVTLKNIDISDTDFIKYGNVEVVIDYEFMINTIKLSKSELSIVEGIIMANGHTYYEV